MIAINKLKNNIPGIKILVALQLILNGLKTIFYFSL